MPFPQLKIGLVIPETGPSGIFGPSCSASAELAIDELNQHGGGILGREVVVTTIDGGKDPVAVSRRVEQMSGRGEVEAVVGWHTSAVREQLASTVSGVIPYVYTAVYEGGEYSPGVFLTGEVPDDQVIPALSWMARSYGVRSWYVVGSDYVWPRSTVSRVLNMINVLDENTDREIVLRSAEFLPLGCEDETRFDRVIDSIESSGADGVLVLLLGQDAVRFNRLFAQRGLHRDIARLSPLMDENMLLASGAEAVENVYSVSGYFEGLVTDQSMRFESNYMRRHGEFAPPVTSPGESCYEGIVLLARLAKQAGELDVRALARQAELGIASYESPRGRVGLSANHLAQDIYIAKARDFDFDVLARMREE